MKTETKLGKETKRLEYVEEELPVLTLLDRFKKLIQPYIHHAFFTKWQAQEFQTLRDNFPLGTIVSIVDFAENYSSVHQKEIQSDYYFNKQVTIISFFVHDQYSLLEKFQVHLGICKMKWVLLFHSLEKISCNRSHQRSRIFPW